MGKKQKFFNRELSWIEFNARVLDEAADKSVPPLERLKFLTIVTSNFDEFFMIRVAGLRHTAEKNPDWRDSSGLTARQQLERISERVHELTHIQNRVLNKEIFPELEKHGLAYVPAKKYTLEQKEYTERLFRTEIFPLLTPRRTNDNGQFPYITNLRLHAAFLLKPLLPENELPEFLKPGKEPLAIVQIPHSIPRVIWLPSAAEEKQFTLVDDIISLYGTQLFPGYSISEKLLFKVTCDADFAVDEETKSDFIQAMEEVLSKRDSARAVRLVCNDESPRIQAILKEKLALSESDIYPTSGIVDISTLTDVTTVEGFQKLKNPQWKNCPSPAFPEKQPLWATLRQKDVMLHVPYEAYDPVVRMLNDAASDPAVLAIKMTLYRTSGDSPIVRALEKAAQNGKQVTAFVELKARFDEKRNISWAAELEQAGAIVIYGIQNLKVHAKMLLIVRREQDGIQRYVHMSTGNYNDTTARLYSDISLFTTNVQIANDATLFFNMISGYSAIQTMRNLYMAPVNLKSRLLALIEREIQTSTPESPGLIIAKMNSLAHEEIIEALYRASCSNVRVLLNVRGICMLVPGVKKQSENITVVSIVDRYLEHARMFYFQNAGAEELYLSSADWMPRNLDRRVELMFPVVQQDIFSALKDELMTYFRDNTKAHYLDSSGTWVRRKPVAGEDDVRAQEFLYDGFKKKADALSKKIPREFIVRR